SLYAMGLKGKDFPLYAIEQSDLILAVGYDVAEYDPVVWNPQKKPIIHIDFLPSEVYDYYDPKVEIVADISATLWELNNQLGKKDFHFEKQWFVPVRRAIEKDLNHYELNDTCRFTVPGVLLLLRRLINDDDIIISDVGAHKIWIGRNFPVYNPGTCIISNGFASMGIAVPGGIAAKLACPEKNVIAVCGDGGFLMNSQEIETAKRIGVGYTILILNDNDYGLISWKQKTHVQKSFGTVISNPDFKKYAESFGVNAYMPRTKSDLETALRKSIHTNEVNIIAVDIDPSENVRLSEKLNSDLSTLLI
ncbi:MAG TPA: thiamine pyrophosphate-dependent enzyme, partial [Patescibacteria group bacterium]|nr:thiamine pyrophosphate-dependent enzyme [Patescibacteria group bacterium]